MGVVAVKIHMTVSFFFLWNKHMITNEHAQGSITIMSKHLECNTVTDFDQDTSTLYCI